MKIYKMITTSATTVFFGLSMLYAVSSQAADGKTVYETVCKICHATGVMGAPKFADKAAWAARSKQGLAVLEERAIKGFKGKMGMMPPKGGNAALTDDEVKAAVAYMLETAK